MSNKYILLFLTQILFSIISHAQDEVIPQVEALEKQGQYQEALDVLTEHLILNQADVQALIKRASINTVLGRIEERNNDLELALHMNPFAFLYVDEKARALYYEKKNYTYNFKNLKEDFAKSPIQLEYYEEFLNKIESMHAQDSLIETALTLLREMNLEQAEYTLNQIENRDEMGPIVFDILGLISLKKNMPDIAIDYFTKAIDIFPKFTLAYHNRAIAYKTIGEYEKARLDLNTAINLNEDFSVLYFTQAQIYKLEGKENRALRAYEKALLNDPEYKEAKLNYVNLQKALGDYENAISGLSELIQNRSNTPEDNYIKGSLYFTYGEYEKAVDAYNKYLRFNDSDGKAHFNRGVAKILDGKLEEGCDDIEKSLELNYKTSSNKIYTSFCRN